MEQHSSNSLDFPFIQVKLIKLFKSFYIQKCKHVKSEIEFILTNNFMTNHAIFHLGYVKYESLGFLKSLAYVLFDLHPLIIGNEDRAAHKMEAIVQVDLYVP